VHAFHSIECCSNLSASANCLVCKSGLGRPRQEMNQCGAPAPKPFQNSNQPADVFPSRAAQRALPTRRKGVSAFFNRGIGGNSKALKSGGPSAPLRRKEFRLQCGNRSRGVVRNNLASRNSPTRSASHVFLVQAPAFCGVNSSTLNRAEASRSRHFQTPPALRRSKSFPLSCGC